MSEKAANVWRPLPETWEAFAEEHPELDVGTAPAARSRFCSRHGSALIKAGALLKARGVYYAHRDKFAPLAYAATLGLPLQKAAETAETA